MRLVILAAAIAFAALPAFAQITAPPATSATEDAAPLTAEEEAFVEMATSNGLYQMELSRLALGNTQSLSVRTFAQRMIDDHTRGNQELMTATGKTSIDASPGEMNAEHAEMIAELQDLKDDAFDRAYVEQQIAAQNEAIKLYQAQARTGENAALRRFADEAVPVLQQHHAMAQDLTARLDQGQ